MKKIAKIFLTMVVITLSVTLLIACGKTKNSAKNNYDMSSVKFESGMFMYDGTEKSIEITGTLPNGVSVTYENNGKVEAGSYEVRAIFTGDDNHNKIPDMIATLTIRKATYDLSNITFNSQTVLYDGNVHSLKIDGVLPEGVSVTYENNDKIELGTYEVKAIFTGDDNYNKIPDMTATLSIEKTSYDLSNVKFNNQTVPYDGNIHSLKIEGELPKGVTVTYENNGKVDAGTYEIRAIFTGDDSYKEIPDMIATLTIEKVNYDLIGIQFDNVSVPYDGQPHNIEISGVLPDGVTVTYENNGKIEIGTYEVNAIFTGDKNHNEIPNMTATLTITYLDYDMTGIQFDNVSVPYDGQAHSIEITGALPEGVTVTYENNGKTEIGTYEIKATFTGDKNHNKIPDMTATLTITYLEYDMTGVSFNDKTVPYDGNLHNIEIVGQLPDGLSVTYQNNGKIDAGTYIVKAIFTGDKYHKPISNMTAKLIITKIDIVVLKEPTAKSGLFYDEGDHILINPGQCENGGFLYGYNGINFSADLPVESEAGEYTIYYKAVSDKNHNETQVKKLVCIIEDRVYTKGLIYEKNMQNTAYTVVGINDTLVTEIIIPEAYKGKPVTAIGQEAFIGLTELTSLTVSKSVTDIYKMAFKDCAKLKTVTIPDTVRLIGKLVFSNTAWYNDKPDGLIYVGKVAYDYKGYMPNNTKIVLNEGTISISDGAFYQQANLISITIPNSVISIGDSAFYKCIYLSSINIPDSVQFIADHAFENCESATTVNFGNGVKHIGMYAFRNCYNIKSIVIPDSVTFIGSWAFNYCPRLETVTLGNGLKTIKAWTFDNCDELTSVIIPDSVQSIDEQAFYDCEKLASVTIGKGVTIIYNRVFDNCIALTSITYNGTIEEWNKITKGIDWRKNVPATVVHCTDGDVNI